MSSKFDKVYQVQGQFNTHINTYVSQDIYLFLYTQRMTYNWGFHKEAKNAFPVVARKILQLTKKER